MEQIQCLAAGAVTRVIAGRSLDAQLAAVWRSEPALTAQQRGAVQDLVYGVLRHLGMLDAISAQLLQKPLADAPVRDLLRVALYQLGHTRAGAHAIVDHAVTACGRLHPQARGLVNAVLRNYLRRRDEVDALAASTDEGRYSHPPWWMTKLAADHPGHWREMLEAGNSRPPLTLRVNRRKTGRDVYLEDLARQDIAARPVGHDGVIVTRPRPVAQLPGFADGHVSVQDAGAQLAAGLLDVGAGMRVLDACAAPGGKTAHLLELADIDLVAADIDGERLQRVAENLQRLSLSARLLQADAGQPEDWRAAGTFDRILADVPCTASGVVRRHPDIKWLRKPGDVAALAKRQARILDTLWQLLRGGGKLLYATCSLFREENGRQVEQFIARHADARLIPLTLPDGMKQIEGQLLPDAAHDGFFYALLEKI
ncbi:MAG: 16S rRNA (cytosine(967)-C(5))-methyltransferase RsmB [Burkholderiales bacterium]|nr:16S rRNA (cytosine(967)-C(5))-methyltransferase RsmB [Burkholderiales bacterium]